MILFLLQLFFNFSFSSHWALLVAGSNTWINYRHQADIYHQYQILTKYGNIPKNNIITMAYNDIAYNPQNIYFGHIYNSNNSTNDVYHNILIDYTGDQVNAENFYNILKSNITINTPKVFNSTNNDTIFLYYSDHGAQGLISMPVGDPIYADLLIETINYMYSHNMYKKFIFYLEACESGSMFYNLLNNTFNFLALTASNPYESSYAIYYNSSLNTYMADEFSINFMLDTERFWNYPELIINQYNHLTKNVLLSHPQLYGSFKLKFNLVKTFENNSSILKYNIYTSYNYTNLYQIDNRNINLYTYKLNFKHSKKISDYILYLEEYFNRSKYKLYFYKLLHSFDPYLDLKIILNLHLYNINFNCLRKSYFLISTYKFLFYSYNLQFIKIINFLCLKYNNSLIYKHIIDIPY